jgi:hypothetical protein
MSCQIRRDNNNNLLSVHAPNGNPSLLFEEISNLVDNDKERALSIWAGAYTPEFLYKYGNWISREKEEQEEPDKVNDGNDFGHYHEIERDKNGEPLVKYLSIPGIKFQNNSDTETKIKNFLTSIGVKLSYVEDLLPKDVSARADFLNRIIHIAKDKQEITTLPEEAAHFYVRLLPESSPLRKELFNQISSYPVYKSTLAIYSEVYKKKGKPDFEKIKEEAVGKLIAQAIINPDSVHTEQRKVQKAQTWINRILDYISKVFSKHQNPFIQGAENILESKVEGIDASTESREEDIMYQLSSNLSSEQVHKILIENDQQLKKILSSAKDPETGKQREVYSFNGQVVGNRVTDLVKKFYEKIFPGNIEKSKREYFNLLAEEGSKIHADIEDIFSRVLSSEGKLLAKPRDSNHAIKTNAEIYSLLQSHIIDRLTALIKKYGDNTRFAAELKIIDKSRDTAGTIDLLVIKPNGRVDILDWKSMNIIPNSYSGVPWYKQDAYTIQLDEYEKILNQIGIQVDLKRAIPIRTIYEKNPKDGKYNILSSIEVGNENISLIPEENTYLLPVPSKSEKTGIETVDGLIIKLEAMYDQIKNQKVPASEKFGKIEELNNIRKAITGLQVNQTLTGLITTGELLISNIEKAMTAENLDITRAQLFYKQIKIYSDLSKTIDTLEAENFTDGESISEESKGIIYKLSGAASLYENKLKKFLLDKGNEVAMKVGVDNVTKIEKNPSWWAANIRSIGGTATNAVRTFYKYLVSYQDGIYRARDENNASLSAIKKDLEKWGQAKNIPASKLFDGILEFDEKGRWKGTFLTKYDKKLWELREKYISEKDLNKLESLLDLSSDVRKKFEEKKTSFLKWVNSNTFSLDQEKDKKIRDKKIQDWHFQYDVFDSKYKATALLNRANGIAGNPLYYSQKWKALQQEPALLAAYNYFQSLLSKAEKTGIIEHKGNFIPSINNDKLDMWIQYGSQSIFNIPSFFESFEYKSGNTWGEIDPLTGKPLQSVPRLFLNNLAVQKTDPQTGENYLDFSMKSKDLFTVFSIWGKYIAEYEYMSSLEEVGNLMTITETIKDQHLHRGTDGKYMAVRGNEDNIAYLSDFINYYVYGRKLNDDNPWEFELFNKQYSGKKMVQGAIRYMGMKTLAFNTISIAANYIGGKFNSFFSGTKGQFFNRKQWANAEFSLGTDKGKALIDWFDVFLEDTSYHKARQLSVYGAVQKLSYDHLFIGQRISDKLVQYPVLLAMTQSYGIIDGKIINLKQHLRDKYGFENFYQKSITEQKMVTNQIETELKKIEKTHSLWALSKIKDGKLEIEGLTRNMETVMKFRQTVKRANKIILGNSTTDDIARYRMSLLGQALGQFRNWIPAMMDERFSELRYDEDSEAWTTGKLRSFYANYFSTNEENQNITQAALKLLTKHFGTLLKDLVGLSSLEDIQTRAKVLYAKEKLKTIENGLPFEIKESEYIEMHINNVRSTIAEMRLILSFTSLAFSMSGKGDDDKHSKGLSRFITRSLDKFNNELLFYYNPINFTDLINSPIPVVGLATDTFKFMGNLAGEVYGRATGDEKMIEKSKPTKYILKDIPISRELYNLGTIFSEDMRRAYEVTN